MWKIGRREIKTIMIPVIKRDEEFFMRMKHITLHLLYECRNGEIERCKLSLHKGKFTFHHPDSHEDIRENGRTINAVTPHTRKVKETVSLRNHDQAFNYLVKVTKNPDYAKRVMEFFT